MRVVVTATNAGGSASRDVRRDRRRRRRRRRSTRSPPTISGTARDGADADALDAAPGPARRPITFTYQWQRCDAAGANCADIAGATGATYTLDGADVGATHPRRRHRARTPAARRRAHVRAERRGRRRRRRSTRSRRRSPAPRATARRSPPADGTWTGTPPITYTYQWQRCDATGTSCADIAGATGVDLRRSTAADVGSTRARRRHRDERRRQRQRRPRPRPATSPPAPPVNTVAAGDLRARSRDGQTLTRRRGTWTGHAADHLHLPVAALRRGRHQLRRHRRRDRLDATTSTPADVGSTRPRRRHRRRTPAATTSAASAATATSSPRRRRSTRRAGRLRHATRRPDADRRRRHVDRHADRSPTAYQWQRCDATARTAPTSPARRASPTT